MNTTEIQELLHQAAEKIRAGVLAQVDTWRLIPYWTLESEGRSGWNSNHGLPYQYGLLGLDDKWPHRLFVELSSGRLITSKCDDASDSAVVKAFLDSRELFDATARLDARKALAASDSNVYSKAMRDRNDARRAELRDEYKVPEVWTQSAKPIRYRYQA